MARIGLASEDAVETTDHAMKEREIATEIVSAQTVWYVEVITVDAISQRTILGGGDDMIVVSVRLAVVNSTVCLSTPVNFLFLYLIYS